MRSSYQLFELRGRVLLPISTNLHHATGILLTEPTFVVNPGSIEHLWISRQFGGALAACCEATLVAEDVWTEPLVRISNKFFRFGNGAINALVETAAQFHAVD